MAVKLPLGTLALLGCAAVGALFRRPAGRAPVAELPVLLPAAALLIFVSSQTGFSHHLRYVLPAWPFLFIGASRVLRTPGPAVSSGSGGRRLLAAFVVGCLGWNAAEAVARYPHYLAYFNPLAGGPDNGGRHLINSNLDWGQDLLALRRWCDDHPEARPLHLAYFNFVDPALAGLSFRLPPMLAPSQAEDPDVPHDWIGPHPGWYAVSANFVYGMGFRIPDGEGGRAIIPIGAYAYFQELQPVAKAGYSIFIYHISPEEADQARARLGLPPLPADRRRNAP
jgi:hypothetical protein